MELCLLFVLPWEAEQENGVGGMHKGASDDWKRELDTIGQGWLK